MRENHHYHTETEHVTHGRHGEHSEGPHYRTEHVTHGRHGEHSVEFRHHEESGYPERGRYREHGEGPRYHEESEHGRGRERGERSRHHEEPVHAEHGRDGGRGDGPHHHASWRYEDEDGSRGGPRRERGQRRERVERGMLRYLLLDALQHGPKLGYEIIKWLEDQTYGRYAPSAGIVYPTLQLLEDQGFILAERKDEKSIYRLTETGETELQTRADFIQEFWARYGHPVPPPATRLEIEFVQEELQELQRIVEKGVRVLTQDTDQQHLLALRQSLERSKNEIRNLLARSAAPQQVNTGGSQDSPLPNAREIEEAITQLFVSEDEALRQTLVRAKEQGLPEIQVSALLGKLLQMLAMACQAHKILEIGALAGYSGIWLARALPADGRLITLEINATHAEVVRESFRQAGVAERAEVRVGPALETLPTLTEEGPFDLIFIDADKDSYSQYLDWAIRLAHPGSVIVADNCVLAGKGLNIHDTSYPRAAGARAYNQNASSNPLLSSISLPLNSGITVSIVLPTSKQEQNVQE